MIEYAYPQKAGVNMDIIEELKALPFTLEVEQDKDGYFAQVVEFPEEYEQEATEEQTLRALARGLKGWAGALADDVDRWRQGRENELPYLLKILASREDELLECLRNSRRVNS